MVSLQKLLGKEDKFYDLLEASTTEACHSVQALKQFLQNPAAASSLEDLIAARRKDKAIRGDITTALCTTFVSVLEREDIESLSATLYKVPKAVEKIAERIRLAPQFLQDVDLSRQVVMLEKATATVRDMVQALRGDARLESIRQMNEALQTIEGDADKLVLDLLRDLYSGRVESTRVVFLKDLFELLEKVTDHCRDAGNIIIHIALKNA